MDRKSTGIFWKYQKNGYICPIIAEFPSHSLYFHRKRRFCEFHWSGVGARSLWEQIACSIQCQIFEPLRKKLPCSKNRAASHRRHSQGMEILPLRNKIYNLLRSPSLTLPTITRPSLTKTGQVAGEASKLLFRISSDQRKIRCCWRCPFYAA